MTIQNPNRKPFTKENLINLEIEWFANKFPYERYGQAMCNRMILPKDLEDKIFYQNTTIARMYLWEHFGE